MRIQHICSTNTEGIHKGLYEGLDTTIYREVPQYMFYFIVYDSFRKILTPYLGDLPAQAIAGGTAGAFSWLPPIFCINVLKTKMQSRLSAKKIGKMFFEFALVTGYADYSPNKKERLIKASPKLILS